jgi:hypothetical protein
LIKSPDIPTLSAARRKNITEDKLLEEEYKWFFENKDS